MLYTVNKKTPYHRVNDDKEIFFSLKLKILFVRNRLTPLSTAVFSGNLNCNVRKPALCRRAGPRLSSLVINIPP